MKSIALAAILGGALVPAAPASAQGEEPALSETGWCVAYYDALARARERRARTPKRLHETAGFFSIDFAGRAAALRARLGKKEDFAITYHQQAFEQAFDLAADAEAEGKPIASALSQAMTHAVVEARKCDSAHRFAPALLDRLAAQPSPPVEPYGCAVNYFALGMGMKSDPQGQRAAMQRIGAAMARFDRSVATDAVWRDILRARIQADAAERNKAVGEGKVKPQDLFTHAQACDRLLATPA